VGRHFISGFLPLTRGKEGRKERRERYKIVRKRKVKVSPHDALPSILPRSEKTKGESD
jgi:hypothetical protein